MLLFAVLADIGKEQGQNFKRCESTPLHQRQEGGLKSHMKSQFKHDFSPSMDNFLRLKRKQMFQL